MGNQTTLDALAEGQRASVDSVATTGPMRRRLQDIGLIEGTRVECLHKSPSGNPAAFFIRGAAIALRNEDSHKIVVHLI